MLALIITQYYHLNKFTLKFGCGCSCTIT